MWGSNPSLLRQRVLSNCGSSAGAKSLQSYSALWVPMDSSPPGSSVHGILQARILEWVAAQSRILEWVAILFSGGSSLPRNWTQVSCIAGRFFYHLSHQERGWDLCQHCVSTSPTCLIVGFSSFAWCVVWGVFRGNSESHSRRFWVSMEGGKFRIFLHYHLEWEPL